MVLEISVLLIVVGTILKHILIVLVLNLEFKKFKANRDIISNIYRTQAYDAIMCGYFMLNNKRLY